MFGNDVSISLERPDAVSEYALSANGMSKEEFGQICNLLMRNKEMLGEGVDVTRLQEISEKFTTVAPPSAGVFAERGNRAAADLLSADLLNQLKHEGYIVIDTGLKTSKRSNRLLSQALTEKSTQHESIRTDSVKFLDHEVAEACELDEQCGLLLGIAGYLNECLSMPSSHYQPLSPATQANPLTNPKMVQAAEYRCGEFYVSHSDNSLHYDGLRVNHRQYTCILYLNEEYKRGDGGQLRIYLGSEEVYLDKNMVYPSLKEHETVDIEPVNCRLLIFDSRLLHSVKPVLQSDYPRQALTVWISRPEDRPLYGDILHSTQ